MVKIRCLLSVFVLLSALFSNSEARAIPDSSQNALKLALTISAENRNLEISWVNARLEAGDTIILTRSEPKNFSKFQVSEIINVPSSNANYEASGDEASGFGQSMTPETRNEYWMSNNSTEEAAYVVTPSNAEDWVRTNIVFNYSLSTSIDVNTTCYAYWLSYVSANGEILATSCIKAYPRWMNEMRSRIENFRVRDLFIPGSHDSGSYRPNFNLNRETLVTKYSLTQDDDIKGQLLHGIRYLDIRVAYYRNSDELFWINHGITKQRPLSEAIQQVRDFVLETNEIVILDVQEFPVGFGKTLDIHRLLVKFIEERIGDLMVDPSLSWQAKLKEIWHRKSNIIVAYDYLQVVDEFPSLLFRAVEQKWGNVQTWEALEQFLIRSNQQSVLRFTSRPVADMAELTPDAWGVVTDKYGGLRRMADNVNSKVSKLYRDDLGHSANIVAVDFFRGTTIVETALQWNSKRVV